MSGMRYPKRYLGSTEEKKKQISEDLADVSTDEEFSKHEKNVREKRYDEFLGEESGSDKEFELPSKYPSLIYPSGSENEDKKSNNKRKKKFQKKPEKIKFPKSDFSSTLKNPATQILKPLITENNSQDIFDDGNEIPDISDENPDQIEVILIKSPEKKKKKLTKSMPSKKIPQKKPQKKIKSLTNKINKSIDDMVANHNKLQSKINSVTPTIIEKVQEVPNIADENANNTRVTPVVTILKPPSDKVYVKKIINIGLIFFVDSRTLP